MAQLKAETQAALATRPDGWRYYWCGQRWWYYGLKNQWFYWNGVSWFTPSSATLLGLDDIDYRPNSGLYPKFDIDPVTGQIIGQDYTYEQGTDRIGSNN